MRQAKWFSPRASAALLALPLVALLALPAAAAGIDAGKVVGLVVDDARAELTGQWKKSAHTPPYVAAGYLHDDNAAKGERSARFTVQLPKPGQYEVRLGYSTGGNRSTKTPVEIHADGGAKTVTVNQRVAPPGGGPFLSLGLFSFDGGEAVVVISNKDTDGYVIVDAIQFLLPEQVAAAKKQDAELAKAAVSTKPPAGKPAAQKKPPPPRVAVWKKPDRKPVRKLAPEQLDALLVEQLDGAKLAEPVSDEQFLRRAGLDLVGRQPTPEELQTLLGDDSPQRRAKAIDRLLADEAFGRNWANYWSDVISHRTPQPELTFLNYDPLKGWLAERLNAGATWDEITWKLLTATGKVSDNPAATFVGFHQASPTRLTSEATRVFLGVQMACAECHDHKFESWRREQFHELAAFFARSEAKLPWNDSGAIVVSSKSGGEHNMPMGNKGQAVPRLLFGEPLAPGLSDIDRRTALADWLASDRNEYFARAYVNRVWSRLMGRGFHEPVDHLSELEDPRLPRVDAALADHFAAAGFDVKDLFRLVMNSEAYRRGLPQSDDQREENYVAARPQPLRGDEVFDSLARAIGLPNARPEQDKADGNFRFPPPPKSTRDLVCDAFGFDPSVDRRYLPRTMRQAMWMMNNKQLQARINADPKSDTMLAKLLAAEPDNGKVVQKLFVRVLARRPSEKETEITLAHVAGVKDRGAAFEDVLWSLVNTAEFTTRR